MTNTNKKMTKEEQKQFNEWAHGTTDHKTSLSDVDYEPGSDSIFSNFDTHPRVVYFRNLGYRLDTWAALAWAEVNVMKAA